MKQKKPTTRTEASMPRETRHLTEEQKQALDIEADAEHSDGRQREVHTREMERLGQTQK